MNAQATLHLETFCLKAKGEIVVGALTAMCVRAKEPNLRKRAQDRARIGVFLRQDYATGHLPRIYERVLHQRLGFDC